MGVQMVEFHSDKKENRYEEIFRVEEAKKALYFHESLPGYASTPLRSLSGLAEHLGLKGLYVKDESFRFGLNAFKGLGGSYALARVIGERLGIAPEEASHVPEGSFTFVTATDGNHGRGVAWAAQNLGQKAVVYMPKGSAAERLQNIRRLGAEAEITEYNYDDTVRFAAKQAAEQGWILVQDTAWEGYETIPTWIMQGYMTMVLEAVRALGDVTPSHVFLQAGVGAMAGAVTGFLRSFYKERMPKLIYVEPEQADCLYRTAEANDGRLHKVEGDLDSIMAGLCCGEVCTVGWEVIRHNGDAFFSCPDQIAADGMRVLGNPLPGDDKVISGESGAVTTGLLYHLMRDTELAGEREKLGLDETSVVLCISTEGDTDQKNYRRIVWDGAYAKA